METLFRPSNVHVEASVFGKLYSRNGFKMYFQCQTAVKEAIPKERNLILKTL